MLSLFRYSRERHLHLDWRLLDQWLPHPDLHCQVIGSNGQVQAALGATIHTPANDPKARIAWLRFAAPLARDHVSAELDCLWQALYDDLKTSGVQEIALLAASPRTGDMVRAWGFEQSNEVVSLRRSGSDLPESPHLPPGIREITLAELGVAAQVDEQAFTPLWQYSRETLECAFRQAATTTLLEHGKQVLGYQLSTVYAGTGHLARLAIIPEAQGQGYGGLLVREMLCFMAERQVKTVTVNTQADNTKSLRLYTRLGFERTGYSMPVWTLAIDI